MAVGEQAVVLTALAESVAKPGCRFLEVGTWCGDSAVVVGKVAKRNGGHLFCVDWWKGNVGTDLARIAGTSDVFSVFWKRMCDEGLEDVVIPIRGRSDDVADILAPGKFDMIYLDGDHRYDPVAQDIAKFSALVAPDGVLCGDDCEGRIGDYDPDFLDAGRAQDFHESVHCGVVLAVGQAFPEYSIDYNVWSVRRSAGRWLPGNPDLGAVPRKRQFPPPLIETIGVYNIIRYGRRVYAVPHAAGNIDITAEAVRNDHHFLSAETLPALKALISDAAAGLIVDSSSTLQPRLVGSFAGFNIVGLGDTLYAINRSLGHVDIAREQGSAIAGVFKGQSLWQLLFPMLAFRIRRLLRRLAG